MRKKYIGKSSPFSLINGKVYEVIDVSKNWYRIVDETGEDYLYPPELFCEENEEVDSLSITYSEYVSKHLANKD